MGGVFSAVLLLAFMPAALGQSPSRAAAIPINTAVEIELLEKVSSETMHDGQAISFKVVKPVEVDGIAVLAPGTPISGEVHAVKASGAWRKAGSFDLTLKPIKLSNGSTVHVDFLRPRHLSTRKEKTVIAIAAVPVLTYYFPLIPFMLVESAKHGKPYEIRTGERYLVYVIAGEPPTEPIKSQPATESPRP